MEATAFPDLFIVPIDFSQASLNASYTAIELATKQNARIKLVHTYISPDIRPMSVEETDFYSGSLINYAEIREEAEKNMAAFVGKVKAYTKLKSLPEVPITFSLLSGVPDEITLYTAQTENARLIVLGVSGKDVRTFEPMGKIASRIVEKSSVPVLVIPEDIEFKGLENFKNILYTTSFDESDFAAIGRLISIARWPNVNIYCLHIGTEEKDQWDKLKMEGLREYFHKVYGKTNVACDLIFSKDVLKALDEFITSRKIDLISLTTHKRNIISKIMNPSIALKILYHTRIPLLVFHG